MAMGQGTPMPSKQPRKGNSSPIQKVKTSPSRRLTHNQDAQIPTWATGTGTSRLDVFIRSTSCLCALYTLVPLSQTLLQPQRCRPQNKTTCLPPNLFYPNRKAAKVPPLATTSSGSPWRISPGVQFEDHRRRSTSLGFKESHALEKPDEVGFRWLQKKKNRNSGNVGGFSYLFMLFCMFPWCYIRPTLGQVSAGLSGVWLVGCSLFWSRKSRDQPTASNNSTWRVTPFRRPRCPCAVRYQSSCLFWFFVSTAEMKTTHQIKRFRESD